MIRKLQKEDIGRAADIWLDTNIEAHDFISAKYWRSNFKMVKEMFLQAEMYVYEEENEIKGFVGLNGSHIEGIFVCRIEQSKGIGRQLLDFVKDRKNQLSLSVYQKNMRAVKFYQRENFSIRSEITDQNTGEKEYFMVWENTYKYNHLEQEEAYEVKAGVYEKENKSS